MKDCRGQTDLNDFIFNNDVCPLKEVVLSEMPHKTNPVITKTHIPPNDCVTSMAFQKALLPNNNVIVVGMDVYDGGVWLGRILESHGIVLKAAQSLRRRGLWKFNTGDLLVEIKKIYPDVYAEFEHTETFGARLRELHFKFKLFKKEGRGIYIIERDWI